MTRADDDAVDHDPMDDAPNDDMVVGDAVAPAEREAELVAAGMDEYKAREVVAIETGQTHGCCLPPAGTPVRGLLAETAVTRELTAEEQERVAHARIARGEEPYPTITREHRARLEADREVAQRANKTADDGVRAAPVRRRRGRTAH